MNTLRNHKLAFLLSIVVGLLYASHHFIIPHFLDAGKETYYPITAQSYPDETILYAPRAHAVMEGRIIAGDIATYEHQRGPSILPILNPILLGSLGGILGSLERGIIVSDFLFPSLIFLAVYFLMYELSGRKHWSLIFASLFLFVPKFGISLPPINLLSLKELAHAAFPFLNSSEPFYFSQFEEPKLTFLFFALALLFFIRSVKKNTRESALIAGIFFGLLFYTYLYDWATLLTAMGLFFLWSLYKKDFRAARQTAAVFGIGTVVSLGFWFNLWRLSGYHDVILRAGGEFSHHIRFATVWKSYLRIAALTFGMLALWQKKDIRELRIISALLFAYVVAVNAQVIIGFNQQPDHWYRIEFLPSAIAVWLIVIQLYDLLFTPITATIRTRGRIIAAFFLVYFFAATLYAGAVYAVQHAEDYALPRREAESFAWLQTHTPKGSIVGTLSGSKNSELLMHTDNAIFLPFGFATLAADREITERTMILAKLYGLNPDEFAAYFRDSVYYLFAEEYGDHSFDANFTHYERHLPQDALKKSVEEYRNYGKKLRLPYHLDYLYFDEREGLGRDPILSLPALHKEYDKGGIKIYSFPAL